MKWKTWLLVALLVLALVAAVSGWTVAGKCAMDLRQIPKIVPTVEVVAQPYNLELVTLISQFEELKVHNEYLQRQARRQEEEIKVLKEDQVKQVKGEWGGLRDFQGLEELMQFLIEDQTDKISYEASTFDCDDYAATLVRNAAVKGYRLHYTRWMLTDGITIYGFHRTCEAIVEMERPGVGWARWIVIIEPQSDEFLIIGLEDEPESWREAIIDWWL